MRLTRGVDRNALSVCRSMPLEPVRLCVVLLLLHNRFCCWRKRAMARMESLFWSTRRVCFSRRTLSSSDAQTRCPSPRCRTRTQARPPKRWRRLSSRSVHVLVCRWTPPPRWRRPVLPCSALHFSLSPAWVPSGTRLSHTCTHTHTHTHTRMPTHTRMHTHMHIFNRTPVHPLTHTFTV